MKNQLQIIITAIVSIIHIVNPALAADNVTTSASTSKRVLNAGVGFADGAVPLQAQIGIGVGTFPEYQGAEDYHVRALPLVDISKAGVFFVRGAGINSNDGLASAGLTLFHIDYADNSNRRMQLTVGPMLRVHRGRDEGDSSVLNGLGDIDQSVGIGGFVQFDAGPWQASATVSAADVGNDSDGLLVTLDIGYSASFSHDMQMTTGIATSWADDDYMQAYYGITAAQSARSGLAVFDSRSGFKDVGLQWKASYALSSRWSLEAQAGFWRLLHDAADSPLVKNEGTSNQFRGLLGVSYRF